MALLALPLTVSAEEAVFDFQNNNLDLPVGEGTSFTDGALNAPVTVGEVTLTSVQGDAFYPAIVMKGNDDVIALSVYKNGAIKFNAAEGKAIVKVEATMKSKTFALTPSTGSITDNTWQGNATEVTFSADALYSFLKIVVTTADKNAETEEPVAAAWDVEADNIAAFNAVEDGKVVKLTLNNAKVNGIYNGAYVEDASGATVIKGVTLTAGTALNGYIVGTKSTDSSIDFMNDPALTVEYQLTATDASTFEATATTLTGTVMAGSEVCAQANYGRLITLENVAISGGGQNKTLTVDGTALDIKARDYMGVLPAGYTWPEQASKITGVVIYYMSGWFLMPISADAIVAEGMQPTSVTFTFDGSLHEVGSKLTDPAGYIYNETFTVDNVDLQLVGGSAPSRIYQDANRGTCLTMYKEYATMTFSAPEGYALQKIEFTAAGNSSIDFSASSGAIEGMTWTGNAESVRFLNNATPYLANAVVTLVVKDDATVLLEGLPYVACENIAAFNALENGTYAVVALTDAEVTGISADGVSTVWIQDATGGCLMQYTTIQESLKENTKVSGNIFVVKRTASGNPQMKEAEDTPKSTLTQTEIDQLSVVEGTLAEVNVAANLNKVVKIEGASFVATSATAGTLTQGDVTIDVNNGTVTANQQLHKIDATWEKDVTKMENVTIVAILTAKSATANQLLPISMEETTGISAMEAAATDNVVVYNLQGQRVDQPQKGLYIVNGRKVVIR